MFQDLDLQDWEKILSVNLRGIINTVHAVYPHMLKRKSGHIVNVASARGLLVPDLYGAPYFASKFAVVGLSEALMLEASAHNIGVSCICPGAVKTLNIDMATIKGFSPDAWRPNRRILSLAEEPEDTARSIIRAVKKDKFLVVTTTYMKVIYFLRRHFSLLWFPVIKIWARWRALSRKKFRI